MSEHTTRKLGTTEWRKGHSKWVQVDYFACSCGWIGIDTSAHIAIARSHTPRSQSDA